MPFFVDSYALHDVDDTIVKWLVGTFEPNSGHIRIIDWKFP